MAKKAKKTEGVENSSISPVIQFAVVFVMLAAFALIAYAAQIYK